MTVIPGRTLRWLMGTQSWLLPIARDQTMARRKAKCSACGIGMELDVPAPLAGAGLAGALCPACTDCAFLKGGGAILKLQRELEGARFPLDRLTITGGAVAALAAAGEHAASFLARHVRGDWGENGRFDDIDLADDERRRSWEATEDSGKINKSNVLNRRDRIMSEYQTSRGHRLWIITSLDGGGGTTVLLPEEY